METPKNYRLDYECFGVGGNRYQVSLCRGRDERRYLKILRLLADTTDPYHGSHVIVFERDFEFFVEAIGLVLRRFAHGEGRPA